MDLLRSNVPTKSMKNKKNWERNKTIQLPILIVNEKSSKQLILMQIVYGKGGHVCIDNKKSKKLQLKP